MYRVTQILKIIYDKDLEEFKAQVGPKYFEKIMKHAAARGTKFHECTEFLENNYQDRKKIEPFYLGLKANENNRDIIEQVKLYDLWLNMHVEKVIYTEKNFYSKKWDLGGRPDLCVKIKGKKHPFIIDKKFTVKISLKNHLQLAAYIMLHDEVYKEKPGRIILHFTREGKINPIYLTNYARDHAMFMFAYNLYKYYNGGTK